MIPIKRLYILALIRYSSQFMGIDRCAHDHLRQGLNLQDKNKAIKLSGTKG